MIRVLPMCTGSRSVSVKIRLILFLLGTWAVPAPPAAAQDETLTGWFSFTVADYPTESGLASEITYALTEDLGERYELLIDIELMQPLGGPMALNRKRVTVMGEWEEVGPDETEKFWVYSIELAPSPSTASPDRAFAPDLFPDEPPPPRSALPAAATNSRVRGSQAWVTILCRFADATDVTPYPVSFYEGMMSSSYPGLGHYWREVSDGFADLNGSVVVGWYNLPQPQSYYRGAEEYHFGKIVDDCTAAADAAVFFPDFDGINLAFNRDFDPIPSMPAGATAATRGESHLLTLDRQRRFWGVTWMAPEHQPHQYIWAHEMGHALGLLHSSGPYGQDDPLYSPTTYGSRWDVMSGGQSLDPYPGYGYLGVHTIAYHKDFLGWIPADRKYVARPNTTRTITLERLAQPGADGYLMAQIPIGRSRTNFYTVEARLFAGYDDEIPDEAIVIHKVDTTREDRLAQVVDVDNNGDPNDAGAMWTVGEIFTDRKNALQVSIDAAYETGYRVTINTDPATFSTCIDFLANSSLFFGPGGAHSSVQVVRAASDCDWSATSQTAWIRITDGGTGSGRGKVSYTVTPNPNPTARTGTLILGGWTITVTQAGASEVLFEDDMESGTGGWRGSPPWALSRTSSRSGTHAWTLNLQDADGGSILRSQVIDLREVESAILTFWHRFSSTEDGYIVVKINPQYTYDPAEGAITRILSSTQDWTQEFLDLSSLAGQAIRISLHANVYGENNVLLNTEGVLTIDDVAVFSLDSVTPELTHALLENPSPESFQSGVGVISGWACEAQNIVIELNGEPYRAGYPTTRPDTLDRCGDTDNGFSLLWNWNNLEAGTHTVRALIDGVEFANTTVRVTTFGEQFLRGASGTFDLPNFPASGETTVVQWEEALQNFVITDGQPNTGGGYNRVAGVSALLENPSLGSAQSGVGVISGWACEAGEIVIELDGMPLKAGYGTTREDTRSVCGDADNGFSLLWNWNNLGAGTHTVRALIDGVEFANTTVRVTTFGEDPFPRGLNGTFPIPDFPRPGENKRLQWEESLQNFVIIP